MNQQDRHLYAFDSFVLDAGNRILLKDGVNVRLNPKALETLLVLVQNPVQVVEKDRFLKEVWPDSFVEEGSLSQNIHELRKALGDDSSEPRYIETIPKRGYRFVAQVKVSAANVGQIDLTGAEETTVIEKHTFARVISQEIGETELPSRPLASVKGDVLALPGAGDLFWRDGDGPHVAFRHAPVPAGAVDLANVVHAVHPVFRGGLCGRAAGETR